MMTVFKLAFLFLVLFSASTDMAYARIQGNSTYSLENKVLNLWAISPEKSLALNVVNIPAKAAAIKRKGRYGNRLFAMAIEVANHQIYWNTVDANLKASAMEGNRPKNKSPKAHAGQNQKLTVAQGETKANVTLDGSKSEDKDGHIVSYSWRIEGTDEELATGVNPEVMLPVGSTTIVLTVTDDEGLTASDTVEISIMEVKEEGGSAFLPNLFSPNGDQMNDRFILRCSNLETIHWRIYNRAGRLIYETQDPEEATRSGWDGNAFGEPQPAGTYVWILEGSYHDGTPVLIDGKNKGSVTLIQ
jgi:gliding motility-associated-like protein